MRNDDLMTQHDAVSDDQVAPKPWLQTARNVYRSQLIREVRRQHPQATVDEVVELLAKEHVEVSATLVMQEFERSDDRANP